LILSGLFLNNKSPAVFCQGEEEERGMEWTLREAQLSLHGSLLSDTQVIL